MSKLINQINDGVIEGGNVPTEPEEAKELTAKDISFTPKSNDWNVENVEQALDYLYDNYN